MRDVQKRLNALAGMILLQLHEHGIDLELDSEGYDYGLCFSMPRMVVNGKPVGILWHLHVTQDFKMRGDDPPSVLLMYGMPTDSDYTALSFSLEEEGTNVTVVSNTPTVNYIFTGVVAEIVSGLVFDTFTEEDRTWIRHALRIGPAAMLRAEEEQYEHAREDGGSLGGSGFAPGHVRRHSYDC